MEKLFHVQRNGHSWKWTKSIELNIKDKLYTVNTKLGHVGESVGHPMCLISPCFNLFSLSLHDPAAAAKSLQSCPTLCDPTDGSPPGSPVPGSLQARTLECIAISFSSDMSSVQFSSVAQSCLTLCNPVNRNTPGLPVHHQLPELTQTHVHLVGDAIQPSHPLSSPSPPAPNPSQHQGLFQ